MYHDPDSEGYYSDYEDDGNPGGTGNDDLDPSGHPRMMDLPAGMVPRAFLEPVLRELTDQEVQDIIALGQFQIVEDDVIRAPTADEVRERIQSVVGVRDTRTGELVPRHSQVPFRQITL